MSAADPSPDRDPYPAILEQAVQARIAGDDLAARDLLVGIAERPAPRVAQKWPNRDVIASVYDRDRYHCRYCTKQVLLTPLMRLLSRLYPDVLPYHSNWKVGHTHPAYAARSATLDHLVPLALNGDAIDRDNLVTACWVCNRIKGDLALADLGWTLRDIPETPWRGLADQYETLWIAAGRPALGQDEMAWLRAASRLYRDRNHTTTAGQRP